MDNTNGFNTDAQNTDNKNKSSMGAMAVNYQHINGWGIDADPENEPTYPMKNWTGDDHKRSDYTRPQQQATSVEILHSNERPSVSAVFGTVSPPSGFSGVIRRLAFKYSEESLRHWFALVMADRVNVVEGIINDLKSGTIPNIFKEKGMGAAWQHNRKGVIKKVAVTAAVISVAVILLSQKKRKNHLSKA